MKLFRIVSVMLILLFLGANFCASKPAQLPSGPEGPGEFGAYYTHLKYSPKWDEVWRVGPDADIVVRFEDGGHKFVFWRGTSYIPCWVTSTGVWYTNEFVERRGHHSPNTEGCVEPMSDKQCRFSRVRVIESTPARVVVHWRYAPVDVHYEHPFIHPMTGWSDWVDEYYTIYPNAVGVRKIAARTTRPDLWMEFQECIVVNQPGTLPDDNIEYDAVSLANMKGQAHTYRWSEDGGPEFDDGPEKANILKINLKAPKKPFAFVTPPDRDGLITPYEGHGRGSHFNWWDHWPVSQKASDGRMATSKNRPSHSSLCHIGLPGMADAEWKPYEKGEDYVTKLMVHGMTDKPADELVPLAKSWLDAPELEILDGDAKSHGYDRTQMAYVLRADRPGDIRMKFKADKNSPLINPAFVIIGWGTADVEVEINDKELQQGQDFKAGIRETLHSEDLILWLDKEFADEVEIEIESD